MIINVNEQDAKNVPTKAAQRDIMERIMTVLARALPGSQKMTSWVVQHHHET